MGTFATLFHKAGAGIPDEKKKEFKVRIEKLFQMGGMMEIPQETISVSTMDFFGITSDDMILFWDDDENIQFSQELKNWFDDLKSRFDMFMESGDRVENSLYWILELMEYADENYYRVYTFSNFFNETMEHLNDRRFLT